MNPWLAHLDNVDLQWIVDAGLPQWYDAGVDVWLNAPFLVLHGRLHRDETWGHPGGLLGVEAWLMHWPTHAPWHVETPVAGLQLPLQESHRAHWAQALSVALAAEARQRARPEPVEDETEAVSLKFRYITSRLGWVKEDQRRVQ